MSSWSFVFPLASTRVVYEDIKSWIWIERHFKPCCNNFLQGKILTARFFNRHVHERSHNFVSDSIWSIPQLNLYFWWGHGTICYHFWKLGVLFHILTKSLPVNFTCELLHIHYNALMTVYLQRGYSLAWWENLELYKARYPLKDASRPDTNISMHHLNKFPLRASC